MCADLNKAYSVSHVVRILPSVRFQNTPKSLGGKFWCARCQVLLSKLTGNMFGVVTLTRAAELLNQSFDFFEFRFSAIQTQHGDWSVLGILSAAPPHQNSVRSILKPALVLMKWAFGR